jgi:acyl-CoA thioester hydrolase
MVAVSADWLDYNLHMNVAYYSLAFDLGGEELVELAGMGRSYTAETHNSWVSLEAHITYQQEARLGDDLRIESRVLDCDAKRVHLYQEMYRGNELLATHEQLDLHFNLETRRSCPFEPEVLDNFERLRNAQRVLPIPEWVGRSVSMHKKPPD